MINGALLRKGNTTQSRIVQGAAKAKQCKWIDDEVRESPNAGAMIDIESRWWEARMRELDGWKQRGVITCLKFEKMILYDVSKMLLYVFTAAIF